MKKILSVWVLLILVLLMPGLSACSGEGQSEQAEEPEILVLAAFEESPYLRKQVELYNAAQDDYDIIIKQYERSEKPEEDGVLRLQREIVSGSGPDLIDFGNGYTTSDIVGMYTEDLYAWLGGGGQEGLF